MYMLGGAEYLESLYFLFYIQLFYLTWRIGWGLYQLLEMADAVNRSLHHSML